MDRDEREVKERETDRQTERNSRTSRLPYSGLYKDKSFPWKKRARNAVWSQSFLVTHGKVWNSALTQRSSGL